MAGATLTFDLLANDRASSKFDRVGSAASRAGGHLSGLGSKFKSLAKYAAVATVAAAGFAVKFGIDAVKSASDMSESLSKTGVVFGKFSGDMIMWAQTSATAMGMSKQAALESSGTLGNLMLSMGKTPKQASEMSRSMVQLAADLGSFNNVGTDEVLSAMRSGLTGEIAPLRRFGVNLTDATLKAKAMELGLYDGIGALDVSAKSSAAYQLILEQTKTAQGDFARTSSGMANQQRILAANFDDLKANIGKELLPVAVKLMSWMNDSLIPGATKAANLLQSRLGPAFSKAGEIMGKVGDWVRERLIPALSQFKDDAGPGVASAMSAIKDAFKDALPFLKDMGNFAVDTLIPVLGKLAKTVLPIVAENIRLMGKAFSAVGRLFTAVWNNLMQPVITFLIKGIAKALDIFGTMIGALSHIPGGMFDWAADAAKKLHTAADEARGLGDSIRKIPTSHNVTITTTYVARGGPGGQGGGGGLGGTPDPGSPAGKSGGGSPSEKVRVTSGRAPRKASGKGMFDGVELRVTGLDPAQRAFLVTGGSGRYSG